MLTSFVDNPEIVTPTITGLSAMTSTKIRLIEMGQPQSIMFEREFFIDGNASIDEMFVHVLDHRPFITVEDLHEIYKRWFTANCPNGKMRTKEVLSKELKANCIHLQSARKRIRALQSRQVYGYFINESAYDNTYIQPQQFATNPNSLNLLSRITLGIWLNQHQTNISSSN